MRVAVFQFRGSSDIEENHNAIQRAIMNASKNQVRLLVFHECATCGYPPVETPSLGNIDFEVLASYQMEVQRLAEKFNMYIALGTIRKEGSLYFNSIRIINDRGELEGYYDKRALWGWDLDNFENGKEIGIFEIDKIKIGFRICFEIRFPEYFRELFKSRVELCFVSFCDVLENESIERYGIIKSHLVTRAVENVMTLVSVNSSSHYQTAPTAVFDINGTIIQEAPINQEYLLIYDYITPEIGYGAKGRLEYSNKLAR